MAETIPFQVRADPDLHARVEQVADRLHLSKNAAYQMLIELGLGALADTERRQHPRRVVNAIAV